MTEAIKNEELLKELDPIERNDLIKSFKLRTFEKGKIILEKGV